MSTIQLKRGLSTDVSDVTLVAGEPAFTTDTGKLYIGDGTTKVLINPDQGTVASADKLTTARTIAITGDATGSSSFDGSSNTSIAVTVVNDGHSHTSSTVTDFVSTVRSSVLTGISLVTNSIISATDSVLSALGKLQAQITANLSTLTSHTGSSSNPHSVTASQVGLGNVTNESKTTMFASPTLTGTPVATTATSGTNTTQIATTAFVTTAVSNKTSVTGNAGTATKLATARTITITGGATGSASFDGSSNTSIAVTISTIDGGTF
jgi:hypothetical protein